MKPSRRIGSSSHRQDAAASTMGTAVSIRRTCQDVAARTAIPVLIAITGQCQR